MALWAGLILLGCGALWLLCDARIERVRMEALRRDQDRQWARDESRMPDPCDLADPDVVVLDEFASCLESIRGLPVGSPRGW